MSEITRYSEQLTGTPFLTDWKSGGSEDTSRADEPWSDMSERLLQSWAKEWEARANSHAAAERFKHFWNMVLQLITTSIPLVIAPLISAEIFNERDTIIVLLLIFVGVAGGVQSQLGWGRTCERHAQACFCYADLVSDAEELLAKERKYRPGCSVTIQRFKMRMDSADRYSPPVHDTLRMSVTNDVDIDSD